MFFGSTHGASFNRARARYHSAWTTQDFQSCGNSNGSFPTDPPPPFGFSRSTFEDMRGQPFSSHVPLVPRDALGLYAFMGLEDTCTQAEVAKNYKNMARRLHPDKTEGATETLFKTLQGVSSVLSDEVLRRRYDQFGLADGISEPVGEHPTEALVQQMVRKQKDEKAAAANKTAAASPPHTAAADAAEKPPAEPLRTDSLPTEFSKTTNTSAEKPLESDPPASGTRLAEDETDDKKQAAAQEPELEQPQSVHQPDPTNEPPPEQEHEVEDEHPTARLPSKSSKLKLSLTLAELVLGCTKVLKCPNSGRCIKVIVPRGSNRGQIVTTPEGLRVCLKRKDTGESAWRRDGLDLHTTVMVPFGTVLYGGDVLLQHLDGRNLRVLMPSVGMLRRCLRSRVPLVIVNEGVRTSGDERGHLFVQCQFQLPEERWFDSWAAAGRSDFDSRDRQPQPGMTWTDVVAAEPPSFAATTDE